MECSYCTRAFQLLAEDARLPPRTTRVLFALITSTPVALRGEPTMVPRIALIEAVCGETARASGIAMTQETLLDVLDEVADSYWTMSGYEGVSSGFFLDNFGLSNLSDFVHFQFDHDFVVVLEQVSRQLRDDAARPP